MRTGSTRRLFLKAAGAFAGAFFLRPGRAFGANDRLNIGLVGIGNRGKYFVHLIPRLGENLVAVCDVNNRRAQEAAKRVPGSRTFQNYRTMLEEMGRSLDAVVVATPDHNHALVSAACMKRGKHVYCEKPMAHDVAEARALRMIARKQKVATQMGNQGMASDPFRRTLELIRQGVVGEIKEVYLWYVFGGSGPRRRPAQKPKVPEYLNWDLWLGGAPFRPYHPTYYNGWGAWRDFGTGVLGGGGSHSINLAFKALRLGDLWQGKTEGKAVIAVSAKPSERSGENFPRWESLCFEIPPRGSLPPVRMYWYDAPEQILRQEGIWARLEKIAGRSLQWKQGWTPRSGSLLVGTKGVVHTNAHNSLCALLPEEKFRGLGGAPRTLRRVESHQREWLDACRGRGRPLSEFEHSGPATELLLLGNICTLVGRDLKFDPLTCTILSDAEAGAALRRTYRKGWSL